ncbi:KR domain-containing protein, partial [Streptomyces sp. BE303]|nr:KR domain-containing protein [Streptomyces sp. BE303]
MLGRGGTGGLGRLVARWAVEHGARRVVLVGRRGTGAAGVRERTAEFENDEARACALTARAATSSRSVRSQARASTVSTSAVSSRPPSAPVPRRPTSTTRRAPGPTAPRARRGPAPPRPPTSPRSRHPPPPPARPPHGRPPRRPRAPERHSPPPVVNETATTEIYTAIYTLSHHDALPLCPPSADEHDPSGAAACSQYRW